MRKFTLTALALCAGAFVNTGASAMPLGSNLGAAADRLGLVEKSQYFYAGREYCWYPDGWHGPGFYWCGYNLRPGFGWGGPVGWRGWHYGRGPYVRGGGPYVRGGGARFYGGAVGGVGRVGAPAGRVGAPMGRVGGSGGGGGGRRH